MRRFLGRVRMAGQGRGRIGAAAALLPLALFGAHSATAQPVVQPIPDPAAERLADALRTLSRNPRSVEALIAAGNASLRLEDVDAAQGFFSRAESVAPTDGRAKAGLATIMLRRDQLAEALQLFGEAERLGAPMASYAADWGLAYDLIGDNANAQRAYQTATSYSADETVTRRLAISQAIAGNRAASEATLLPLLQRQDLAAYRARAFALAILGEEDEAVSIVETMLPERLSSRMVPYLRYMPRLTRAQQAAAANLGRFPPADEIGRGDNAVAPVAPAVAPPRETQRTRDARLVPSGEPLGSARPAASAAAGQLPAPPHPSGELPPIDGPAPPAAPAPPRRQAPPQPPAAVPARDAQPDPRAGALTQPPSTGGAASGRSGPGLAADPPRPELAASAGRPAPAAPPPAEVDLATAFADINQPPAQPRIAAPGAVDITAIQPRREVRKPPSPPPSPPPPPHPSREWVQLATGRDAAALAFDWRRIQRQAGTLLAHAEPYRAAWDDRTRLLAGPYANATEAQAQVAALKAAGVDAFRFTSNAGEEVRPLD